MHEATLAQNLLRMAQNALSGRSNPRVLRVNVLAGALAGVMPDALLFAFDATKPGTAFSEAELAIETQPVAVKCSDCGTEYEPVAFPYECPACRSAFFSVIAGEDVILKSLELDE